MNGKSHGRLLLEAAYGEEGARRRIYAVIVTEVLKEEIRRQVGAERYAALVLQHPQDALDLLIDTLPPAEWQRVDELIRVRIRMWNEEDRKSQQPPIVS